MTDDETDSDSDLDLDPIQQMPLAQFQNNAENIDGSFKHLNIDGDGGDENAALEKAKGGSQR